MGQSFDIEELLGGVRSVVPEPRPIEAGAVHSNGMVDLARLIPRGPALVREKARRSILTSKSGPIS
jgi:hypothetical protein